MGVAGRRAKRHAPREALARRLLSRWAMRNSALLPVLALGLSGCALTFDLAGGPRNEHLSFSPAAIDEALKPRLEGSPEARAELERLQSRKHTTTIFTWTGIASLAPCLGASLLTSGGVTSDSDLTWIIATCGTSIAVNLVSLGVALAIGPSEDDYADVLRIYNREHPETPWTSKELGVDAPAPAVAGAQAHAAR